MQSAEEFGCEISLLFEDAFTNECNARIDGVKALALIRVRDREIVEACKKAALESGLYSLSMIGKEGNDRAHQIMNALGSVLRDLG